MLGGANKMSSSIFSNPLFAGLVGDKAVEKFFMPSAEIASMLDFEQALCTAQAAHGDIPEEAAAAINEVIDRFEADIDDLADGAALDGLIVPALIRQIRAAIPTEYQSYFHRGATSQDLVDTSLAVRLCYVVEMLESRLLAVDTAMADIGAGHGSREVMGWTRMRAAYPVTLEHRLSEWRRPLAELRIRAGGIKKIVGVLHLGGPVGDRRGLGRDALGIANHMAQALQLRFDPTRRHSSRSWVIDLGHWLTLVTGALGKLGQDITLMAQDGIETVRLLEGGGSSAMAHKVNPVAAEMLVSLARYNAAQSGGLQQAMVHEMERSGSAWALEWMILPQMAMATGASLKLAERVLATTDFSGTAPMAAPDASD